ncbi:hypothetical protein C6H69_06155 [Photorhabdus luminescens]|nr:hypothetical protein C6H69_06155 [Photorhabdus luminescens]
MKMSVVNFSDKPVDVSNVHTWPKSPDRDLTACGRDAYAEKSVQEALIGDPDKAIKLSELNDILATCEPFDFNGITLYAKDPVLALIKALSEKNGYLLDDSYSPEQWQSGGVDKHSRIKDFIESPSMFIKGVEMIDMGQLYLGNCGFVSTIGAIASHPEGHNVLFSSIYPPVYNSTGVYSVRIINQSKIGYLLIDDDLPRVSFSAMEDKNEFWYYLIEKAFAKLHGSYENLGGGNEIYFGIESTANTGINQDNQDRIWDEKFIDIFKVKHHVTYQGTGSSTDLVSGHAYLILDAQQWNDIKLVRLHNPWNVVKYKGPYSPGSAEWKNIPEDVQNDIFQNSRFEGKSFWMPYDLYVKNLPKISDMYLSETIPDSLKSIANPSPIQE